MYQTSPDTCAAIRAIHERGFVALVIDNMLMVRAWPARPIPPELIAVILCHADEIAQYLANTV